MQIKGAIEI